LGIVSLRFEKNYHLTLHGCAFVKQLAVLNTAGWEDTVLWNPYGNEGMGFDNFVCVESVKFDPVTLEGGTSWTGDMALMPGSL
jgi:glucose-6-phosphate 1-epimerase